MGEFEIETLKRQGRCHTEVCVYQYFQTILKLEGNHSNVNCKKKVFLVVLLKMQSQTFYYQFIFVILESQVI